MMAVGAGAVPLHSAVPAELVPLLVPPLLHFAASAGRLGTDKPMAIVAILCLHWAPRHLTVLWEMISNIYL